MSTIPFRNSDCEAAALQDGLTLVCKVKESVADVWMMENFDPDRED